jgi:hypothetical protein
MKQEQDWTAAGWEAGTFGVSRSNEDVHDLKSQEQFHQTELVKSSRQSTIWECRNRSLFRILEDIRNNLY